MNLHHWPRSTLTKTLRSAVEPLASSDGNEENSREFGEFLESISATAEELEAIVSMPELSVPEVKQHLRVGGTCDLEEGPSPFGRAVLVKIRPPGARSKAESSRQ